MLRRFALHGRNDGRRASVRRAQRRNRFPIHPRPSSGPRGFLGVPSLTKLGIETRVGNQVDGTGRKRGTDSPGGETKPLTQRNGVTMQSARSGRAKPVQSNRGGTSVPMFPRWPPPSFLPLRDQKEAGHLDRLRRERIYSPDCSSNTAAMISAAVFCTWSSDSASVSFLPA